MYVYKTGACAFNMQHIYVYNTGAGFDGIKRKKKHVFRYTCGLFIKLHFLKYNYKKYSDVV